jgi:hypothetical protein
MIHQGEHPDAVVRDGLLEAAPSRSGLGRVDHVALQSVVGERALLGREPAGGQGRVGKEGVAREGDDTGGSTCTALALAHIEEGLESL